MPRFGPSLVMIMFQYGKINQMEDHLSEIHKRQRWNTTLHAGLEQCSYPARSFLRMMIERNRDIVNQLVAIEAKEASKTETRLPAHVLEVVPAEVLVRRFRVQL